MQNLMSREGNGASSRRGAAPLNKQLEPLTHVQCLDVILEALKHSLVLKGLRLCSKVTIIVLFYHLQAAM
ncbi:unnamed protein product [Victoria cruziana]